MCGGVGFEVYVMDGWWVVGAAYKMIWDGGGTVMGGGKIEGGWDG